MWLSVCSAFYVGQCPSCDSTRIRHLGPAYFETFKCVSHEGIISVDSTPDKPEFATEIKGNWISTEKSKTNGL